MKRWLILPYPLLPVFSFQASVAFEGWHSLLTKCQDGLTNVLRGEARLDLRELVAEGGVERAVVALHEQPLRERLGDGRTGGEAARVARHGRRELLVRDHHRGEADEDGLGRVHVAAAE